MNINLDDYEEITYKEYSSISGQNGNDKLILWQNGKQRHFKKKEENKIFESVFSDMSIKFFKSFATIRQEDVEGITLGNYPNERWDIIEKALEYAKRKSNEQ